jgi:predicted nuclease of predicted toxin-antitoxin system
VRLLADENQHPVVVARLRAAGYSVEFVQESSPGAQDRQILARPDIGEMVLLTYDRDFGDLIFKQGLPAPAAILYTRISRLEPELIASRLLSELHAGIAIGHITTITPQGVRARPFNSGSDPDG